MAGPVLLVNGQPVAPAAALALSPAGVALVLRVPAGETLTSATLTVTAQADAPATLDAARVRLSSDLDAFPAPAAVRVVSASFDGEIAIRGLKLRGASGFARIRTFSNGAWAPLTPIDTVALGQEQVFPAVAAERLVAELLAAPSADAKVPPVPIPSPLSVSSVSFKTTAQPCRVSVSVGDDPAFFTRAGPLPTTPVAVDGLGRIAARWLSEHAGTTDVPVTIRAAGPGSVLVHSFEAVSAPMAAPGGSKAGAGGSGSTPPAPPSAPATPADTLRALLCDPGHAAAHAIGVAATGRALRGLALWVRAGSAPVSGTIALQPDADGAPASAPAVASFDFMLEGGTPPQWLMLSAASPLPADGASWAVCRVGTGELLWYRAPPPAGAIAPVVSVDGGAWQPAPADPADPAPAALQAIPFWTQA
nr:hypothetical protein [uncultured Rhodopila sp.]